MYRDSILRRECHSRQARGEARRACQPHTSDIPSEVRELADEIARRGDGGVTNAQRNAACHDTRTFERYDQRYVLRPGYLLDAKTGERMAAETTPHGKRGKKGQMSA